jgi:hypothetical protein
MTTLQREQWDLKEKADWWSAGQARRQETLAARGKSHSANFFID